VVDEGEVVYVEAVLHVTGEMARVGVRHGHHGAIGTEGREPRRIAQ
jgi:hypothetical protein